MKEKEVIVEKVANGHEKSTNKFVVLIREYCPKASLVIFIIFIIAAAIHVSCLLSENFADFYNQKIGSAVRALLAHLTSWIPFSIAETIIICIPVLILILIYVSLRSVKKSDKDGVRCIVALVSVLSLLYSIFVFGYGMGYHGTSLASKLGLEEKKVTARELNDTALKLLEELDPVLDSVCYSDRGNSVMQYSLDEMNDKLNETYKEVCKKYGFIQNLKSNLKYIVLSEPMTYTHISGVYSYYTGEANLNINFPDYTLPYTAAHELAHQRGIAPENEANFVAFLVCRESDDPYIRYSAYLNMFEYICDALYSADSEMYFNLYWKIDPRIRNEMSAYGEFFEKYRHSVASEVSNAVNDAYLKTQGQSAGSASYGMVVDLAVAFYGQESEK